MMMTTSTEVDWLEVVATAGVEHEDKRVRYVVVQIDRDDWLDARRIYAAREAGRATGSAVTDGERYGHT